MVVDCCSGLRFVVSVYIHIYVCIYVYIYILVLRRRKLSYYVNHDVSIQTRTHCQT